MFFVLSVFLIGGRGVEKIKTGRWNLRDYIVDRVFRVYVILLPALLLTILFDQMGQALFSSTGLWNGTNPNFLQKFDTAFAAQDSVGLFACNVVMLQPFYCSVLGSNIPLWTLSYEFWFYVAFAWWASAWQSNKHAKGMRVFVLGLSIVLLVVVLGTGFLWMMAVWGCGIVACTYRGSRFRHPLPAVATWLILAVVSRLTDIGKPEVLLKNVIMLAEGAGFAWVVVSVRHKEFSGFRLVASTAKKAAAFSYTVYLIHFLGMLLLLGLLSWITGLDIRNGVLSGTVAGILLYIITLVIVMTFS